MERFKKTTIQREIMMKEFCRDALHASKNGNAYGIAARGNTWQCDI